MNFSIYQRFKTNQSITGNDMSDYKVTIHAIQTIEIKNVRDAEKAIEKAKKLLSADWDLKDAVAVDNMGQSYQEEFYDD